MSKASTECGASTIATHTEADTYFLKHGNRPMKALYEALKDTVDLGIELPMAIVMDQRCGIERVTEVADELKLGFAYFKVGATPLIVALNTDRIDVAKALIAAGANLAAVNSEGQAPLHFAAMLEDIQAIKALVSLGANLEAADNYGRTPLHVAARFGNVKVVEALVKLGANHSAADDGDMTPLHMAAFIGRIRVIEVLVTLGANIGAVAEGGQTPVHIAACLGRVKAIEALRGSAAFEDILTAEDEEGNTPLQLYIASYKSPDDSEIRAILAPKG